MKRSGVLTIALLVLVFGSVACKKKPKTNPDLTITSTTGTTPEPAEVTTPPEPTISTDEKPSPLDGTIYEADNWARQQGLIGDVFYDFDSYELRQDARDRLARNADFLRENPQFIVTIEGHADERGTNEYNLALGDRRANAAREYLSTLGVSGDRLRTVSYGEERPFCGESAESCWQQNRRAHFTITGRADVG